MMNFIDTHCHLNFKVFRSRVAEVMERAHEAGVKQVVVVGSHLKNSRLAVRQAQKFAGLWAAIGIHPHHTWDYLSKAQAQSKMTGESPEEILDQVLDEVRVQLTQLVNQDRVVAIGEVGLDRHFYEQSQYQDKQITERYLRWQRAFFKTQLEVAVSADKAVIIHQREAIDDLFNFFEENPQLIAGGKMVFHCCEPDQRLLDFAKRHQFLIGVDGDVTYDQQKEAFIKQVPLEMLLLETDAPFITPEPDRTIFQKKRQQLRYKDRVCEPRHVATTASKVAELKGVKVEKLAEVTTNSAKRLFGIS